jgi:hypothetical protein
MSSAIGLQFFTRPRRRSAAGNLRHLSRLNARHATTTAAVRRRRPDGQITYAGAKLPYGVWVCKSAFGANAKAVRFYLAEKAKFTDDISIK